MGRGNDPDRSVMNHGSGYRIGEIEEMRRVNTSWCSAGNVAAHSWALVARKPVFTHLSPTSAPPAFRHVSGEDVACPDERSMSAGRSRDLAILPRTVVEFRPGPGVTRL